MRRRVLRCALARRCAASSAPRPGMELRLGVFYCLRIRSSGKKEGSSAPAAEVCLLFVECFGRGTRKGWVDEWMRGARGLVYVMIDYYN